MDIIGDSLALSNLSRREGMYIESQVSNGSLARPLLMSNRGDRKLSRLLLQ